mmetsp:Transcript_1911/g.5589  ORF Transcript_1911/g.5589 Transcript_1911/m.5589 type:complete len:252 (-) Transcript_1911:1027-1782(-)
MTSVPPTSRPELDSTAIFHGRYVSSGYFSKASERVSDSANLRFRTPTVAEEGRTADYQMTEEMQDITRIASSGSVHSSPFLLMADVGENPAKRRCSSTDSATICGSLEGEESSQSEVASQRFANCRTSSFIGPSPRSRAAASAGEEADEGSCRVRRSHSCGAAAAGGGSTVGLWYVEGQQRNSCRALQELRRRSSEHSETASLCSLQSELQEGTQRGSCAALELLTCMSDEQLEAYILTPTSELSLTSLPE